MKKQLQSQIVFTGPSSYDTLHENQTQDNNQSQAAMHILFK